MKISKKYIVMALLASLTTMPFSVSLASKVPNVATSNVNQANQSILKTLAQDNYVIASKRADVTGDHCDDDIYLIGHKNNKSDNYTDHLILLVEDGITKQLLKAELDNLGGYDGELFVGDFSGDGIFDVLVSVATGGSGGIVDHRILSFSGGEVAVLFNHENNSGIKLTGQFTDGFKANLINPEYEINTTLDLQTKKDLYVKEQIYDENGVVLKDIKPISYPFSSLAPVDFDHDGIYELKGIQRIIGAYGADGIGNVYSLWKYENKQFTSKSIEITAFSRSFRAVSSIAKPSAKSIILTELDNNKEITVESGDEIQLKLKEISGTGYQWLIDSLDADGIELVSENTEKIANDDRLVGGPYTKVFTFKTKKIGKFDLKLYNFRSWESKDKGVGSLVITINNLPKAL